VRKPLYALVVVLLLASLLAGCASAQAPTQPAPAPVKETVVVKETVQVPVSAEEQEWELVNPEGIVQLKEPVELAPRPASLEGLTIGLRANGKHNSDLFLDRVAELLEEEVKGVEIIKLWEAVPSSFNYPLKAEDVQKIAALEPDIVIGSQAD